MTQLPCPKCRKNIDVDIALNHVTCSCGAVSDVVSDSFFDGEDDHAFYYLELPDSATENRSGD